MTEPRRRGPSLYRSQVTLYAVYAEHGDNVCRFVSMCINRSDAEQEAARLSHVADVYILPHSADKFWRSPIEPTTVNAEELAAALNRS